MPVFGAQPVCEPLDVVRDVIGHRFALPDPHDKAFARFIHHTSTCKKIEHTAEHALVLRQDVKFLAQVFRLDEFSLLAFPSQPLQRGQRIEPRHPLKAVQQRLTLIGLYALIGKVLRERHGTREDVCRTREEVC